MALNLFRFQVLVNNKKPTFSYLEEVKKKLELELKRKEYICVLKNIFYNPIAMELNEKFFFAYVKHGSSEKYSPIVADIQKQQISDNPRNKEQIELPDELYIFYFFEDEDLLISDYNKKGLVKKLLSTCNYDSSIRIKNKFIAFDDFVREIQTLNTVKFRVSDNLINENDNFKHELNSALGFGDSNAISIKVEVNKKKNDSYIKRLRSLYEKSSQGIINSLICIGTDDEAITKVLNADTYNDKIPIEVTKDENGCHDYREIILETKKHYRI